MTSRRRVGNNISKILLGKNMTQTELAKRVRVKREYMNRIINEGIMPTIPLVLIIAKALNKTVEEIFYMLGT